MQDTLSYYVGVFPLFLFQYLYLNTYNLIGLNFAPSVLHYYNGQIGWFLSSERSTSDVGIDNSKRNDMIES
ncbi:hypothetical protein ACN38_g2601 [Penicillium nordicum]|uniref:Uncharacterized protein n=1 Tax=Penicillium nordicum TaxID=229535 RepID=A0A0M9WIS6_9EURO|nr:hypothetical protein ACN38_g2601 [Penicillium nordicum]